MRKFLVVNMNYMGDALLTTPALAALRAAFPDAQIDTVVGAGTAAEVLQGNPDLDRIIARTAQGGASRLMQIFRLLREGRYTDAIILPPLPGYAFAAWLARTPRRVGLAGRGMNHFLTTLRRTRAVHMADAMLDTMPLPPDPNRPRRLVVAIDSKLEEAADRLLSAQKIMPGSPLIAVNVGATRPQKRWFAESFAQTLDGLSDIPVVLVGAGAADTAMAADILSRVQKAQPINLVGETQVKTLAAVLKRCDLLISGDSGPMHLATAVGTPCVALFGSTDPAVTGPFDDFSEAIYKDLSCSPCGNHPTCNGRYDCLREITPEEVVLATRLLLRARRGGLTLLPQVSARPAAASTAYHQQSAQRILIATKFRFIGDTLLATPIFRAARAQWPDAHIALLTGKNARVLLQNNPYLDEIWEFDPYKSDKGWKAYLQLVQRIRLGKFDLCLALNRSFHSALTSWLGGITTRAGFRSEGRGPLLNCQVDYDREKSEIACYFDVLRAAAPDAPVSPALELWISADETARAQEHLGEAWGERVPRRSLVGIQPGASQPRKRWSASSFAQTADALIRENPGLRLALIGGPDERDATEEMLAQCDPRTRAQTVSFAGACDLRGSLALVSQLGLFVGNDTAIMHSAVALGVPTVALFGPTNPRKWGNYGPCHRVLESPDGTMASIDPNDVLAAAQALLASGSLAPMA
jgi:heptosyltransferase-2